MKLVLLSDTHSFNGRMQHPIPAGDVLVHAGDLASRGTFAECQAALDWLNTAPCEHIVVIAGNHDFAFEKPAVKAQLDFGRVTYLENSAATVAGLKIWGSPVQPEFMDWAFNVPRGPAIKKYWDAIPGGLDVLITHGPPFGFLDRSNPPMSEPLGCRDLFAAVMRAKPKLHVFGHIHGGYGFQHYDGINFVNASICDERYRPCREPWALEVPNL
jgi:predicted phosphodiesterase